MTRTRAAAISIAVAAAAGILTLAQPNHARSAASVTVVRDTVRTPAGPAPLIAVQLPADHSLRLVPMLTGRRLLSQLPVVAAINGDYFNLTTRRPSGPLVIAGHTIFAGPSYEPSLGITNTGITIGFHLHGFADVVSGKPRLIVHGQPNDLTIHHDNATLDQLTRREPQVAAGIQHHHITLIAIGQPGLTMAEWQHLLLAHGFTEALSFDNGPSANITINRRPQLNQPEIHVPVAIAVVDARPLT